MDLTSSEETYNQTDISTPVTEVPLPIERLSTSVIVPCVLFVFIIVAVLPSIAISYRIRKRNQGLTLFGKFQIFNPSPKTSVNLTEFGEKDLNVSSHRVSTYDVDGNRSRETVCEFIGDDSIPNEQYENTNSFRACVEKAESWKQKMVATSEYDQYAFSLPYFRAGVFDKDGGELNFEEAGVTLLIPPGAIQQSSPQLIYIYLHNGSKDNLLGFNMMTTSPIVFCGPSGMKFNERVLLSYQHCANIKNNNVKLVTLRTETEPDQCPSFHNLSEDNDSMTLIKGNNVTLLLPHFTGHTTALKCEENDKSTPIVQEKWLDLMLFSSELQEDDYDLQLRLYCANQTPDARYLVLEDERLLKGSMCSPTTPFLFAHVSDVTVLLQSEGDWTVTGSSMKQSISGKCLVDNVRVPCAYRLEYDEEKPVSSFKCQVHVTQDKREQLHGKVIDVLVKKQRSAAGREKRIRHTRLVRRRLLLPFPLRESIRKKLDILSPLGSDWRHFAYFLGYDDCIEQWEEQLQQRLIFSPTNELLNIWESTRSGEREKDLQQLIEIFEDMERLDVISEIKTWDLLSTSVSKPKQGYRPSFKPVMALKRIENEKE